MVDLVKIHITAGKGGDGRISFFRNRRTLKGGPDGGDGGNGGSVVVVGTGHENTLRNFAGISNIEADNGQMGGVTNMHGKDKEDVVIKLPMGTRVWRIISTYIKNKPKMMYKNDQELGRVERPIERRASSIIRQREGVFTLAGDPYAVSSMDEDTAALQVTAIKGDKATLQYGGLAYDVVLVEDLTEEGKEVVIARGGRGGKGNESFKSSRNTTPMEAQTGEGGEAGDFLFELQLLADVGLVGFPNAGKSTLLSVLTKATPKIANYPFTTLEPNLGVMMVESGDVADRKTVVIADIPGLIEGASEGKGLGIKFLRHVSRCKMLIFLLSMDDAILLDESSELSTVCEQYKMGYTTLENELETYEKEATNSSIPFSEKKKIIVLSKSDLVSVERKLEILKEMKKTFADAFWISSSTGEGLDTLKNEILLMIK